MKTSYLTSLTPLLSVFAILGSAPSTLIRLLLTSLGALALFGSALPAATVAVANFDFSDNAGASASNWTDFEVHLNYPESSEVYYAPREATAPDGVAYLMSSGSSSAPEFTSIFQNLSDANAGLSTSSFSSWVINFDAGFRDDLGQSGTITMAVSLIDLGGDSVFQFSDTVLASSTFQRTGDGTSDDPIVLTPEVHNLNFNSTTGNDVGLLFSNQTTGVTYSRTGMIDNITVTAVPEPSAAMIGLVGLGLLVRRRR